MRRRKKEVKGEGEEKRACERRKEKKGGRKEVGIHEKGIR